MSSATIDFPNGERHRVVADEPDRLVIEFAKPPGEGANLSHTHEHSDEVFDVLAGRLRFTLGWTVRELGAGDRIRIPRGVEHSWEVLPGEALSARVEFTPGRGFDEFLRDYAGRGFEGKSLVASAH